MESVFISFLRRRAEISLAATVLMGVLCLDCFRPFAFGMVSQSRVERGRTVYTSEGCSQCHSGNHRKAPDLSQVGSRRSALWLKIHLYDPREVSGSSIMPSYETLFRTQEGNDLVAYLGSLKSATTAYPKTDNTAWRLSAEYISAANPANGQVLYNRYCATCHNAKGRTRVQWQSQFIESPAILRAGAMPADPATRDHLAQIIKFGIPDSDMAGHESMPDKNIASLVAWLTQEPPQPASKQ